MDDCETVRENETLKDVLLLLKLSSDEIKPQYKRKPKAEFSKLDYRCLQMFEVNNNPNNRGEQESNPGVFRPKASTISIEL